MPLGAAAWRQKPAGSRCTSKSYRSLNSSTVKRCGLSATAPTPPHASLWPPAYHSQISSSAHPRWMPMPYSLGLPGYSQKRFRTTGPQPTVRSSGNSGTATGPSTNSGTRENCDLRPGSWPPCAPSITPRGGWQPPLPCSITCPTTGNPSFSSNLHHGSNRSNWPAGSTPAPHPHSPSGQRTCPSAGNTHLPPHLSDRHASIPS